MCWWRSRSGRDTDDFFQFESVSSRNPVRWIPVMILRILEVVLMPPLRRDFGQRIRSIRDERRMTQEEFAELIGISVDFLSLIERGINAPSFETIDLIASRLGVPISVLFSFDDPGESRSQ